MSDELAFSSDELAAMQAAQAAHLMDSCTVDAYAAGSADAYGNPSPTWTAGDEIDCGFRPVRPREVMGLTQVPEHDAELRLAIDTSVNPQDRITITKRHGVAVTNVTYEIVGDPQRGPSGLVLQLKKVVDGS